MREWSRQLFVLTALSLLAPILLGAGAREKKWYRGNTHTHTLWSDGDAPPEMAVDWYKSHGYDFLVLSDHNIVQTGDKWFPVGTEKREFAPERLKKVAEKFGAKSVELREVGGRREMRLKPLPELRKLFEEEGRFLLITGEEITDEWNKLPIHHNSINHTHVIPPTGGTSVRDVMKKTLEAVKAAAAKEGKPVLVHLNHPNWKLAVSADDLANVLEERYFEVFDGAQDSLNEGDAAHMNTERMWDHVLALRLHELGGEPLFGLGTDDAHEYFKERAVSSPGRGWVMVRADALTADAITKAMLAGDFYASSGVTLEDVVSDAEGLTVTVKEVPGASYTVRFIGTRVAGKKLGKVGELLQETQGLKASYRFKGDELYVRATVTSDRRPALPYGKTDVETAWTQPVILKKAGK